MGDPAQSPAYSTLSPGGRPVEELGGWKRVSPPENDPVFAFTDQINGVEIAVSQQPLPASFRNDTDAQVAELAKKFNATAKIDAGTTVLYAGTSTKGPQSVIFTKMGLLILIKSQEKIDDGTWVKYVKNLMPSR